MHTLRQTDGLSGFVKRAESEYDAFGAGHSSTSISAGLGGSLFRIILRFWTCIRRIKCSPPPPGPSAFVVDFSV